MVRLMVLQGLLLGTAATLATARTGFRPSIVWIDE